ncbi:iron chelate uptake ABC transporter, FeCT family, permease protein [Hoylesella buccalis ATCC 35310]|uniref:Iron chelate uptake ABC transporter, FeCT family, permease protein n=1 Tax=Hoylesella buccalis ATCC 35310 TaxID=679190 RepID=D1W7X5_9BACT|nr:iron chelate uptake ABC transporter, FeCT family, permease protein [Hoylesella buccalis ATCC 35310]
MGMTKNNIIVLSLALLFCICLLLMLNLLVGSVSIPTQDVLAILSGQDVGKPSWQFIILQSRLPQALTALLCGAALSTSGLLLQTSFQNPLAGPSIFGINSGAALGVALVMLLLGGSVSTALFSVGGAWAVLLAAFVGAMAVTGIIFMFAQWVKSSVMLLIIGMMIGYLASSAIALLNFFATQEGVKSFTMWGMGNFGGVSLSQLPMFTCAIVVGLVGSVLLIKPLNALLLGETYARNLGVDVRSVRSWLLVITGWLTAVTTAYCGPVAFIGLAVPHLARLVIGTDNHLQLLPITMAMGALIALLCQLVCVLPGSQGILPLNAVTPLIGAPVIIYIIWKR